MWLIEHDKLLAVHFYVHIALFTVHHSLDDLRHRGITLFLALLEDGLMEQPGGIGVDDVFAVLTQ